MTNLVSQVSLFHGGCVCVSLCSYMLRQLILFIQINSFNTHNNPMKLESLAPFYI